MNKQQSPTDDQLLAMINTRERYEDFKRYMGIVKVIARLYGDAPIYSGMPRHANALDSYDPERALLTYNFNHWRDYSRFIHACLSGQYELGQSTVPRYSSARLLDRHATNTFFAPFPVSSQVNSTRSLAPWDRNASRLFSNADKPINVSPQNLFWNRSEQHRRQFRSLVPLYTNYRDEGLSQTGIALNRNSMLIVRYVLAFLESANGYRSKLSDVAKLVQTQTALLETRRKLIERIARIEAEQKRNLVDSLTSSQYNSMQKSIIRRFNAVYNQTLAQIRVMSRPPQLPRRPRRR